MKKQQFTFRSGYRLTEKKPVGGGGGGPIKTEETENEDSETTD